MKTDTPRTDKKELDWAHFADEGYGPSGYVQADFARRLERELAEAVAKERERCVKAVEEEEECPGEMPDEMWATIKNDRDAATRAMQITARCTKRNIIARIEAGEGEIRRIGPDEDTIKTQGGDVKGDTRTINRTKCPQEGGGG